MLKQLRSRFAVLAHLGLVTLLLLVSFSAPAATRYTYDELNRLTRVVYDDGRTIDYAYDPAGNLLSTAKTGPALTSLEFVERPDTGSGWNLRVTLTREDASGHHGTFNLGDGACTGTLTYKGRDQNQNHVFTENHLTGGCYKVCDIVVDRDANHYNERCFGTASNGTNYTGTFIAPVNRRWVDPHPTSAQLEQVLGLTQVDVGGKVYVSVIDFKPTSLDIAVDTSTTCRYGLVYNAPPYTFRPNTGEWDVPVPTAGTYRVVVNYSAEQSRPVVVSIDGATVNGNALAGTNGTYCTTPLMEEAVGEVTLAAGTHLLRLSRDNVFPHLQRIVLQRVR